MSEITSQEIDSVVLSWRNRAEAQGYRPGTKTYAKVELEFFLGVIAALLALGGSYPPVWEILIRSGRSLSATLRPLSPNSNPKPSEGKE